jgi:hypothetical protein
MVSTTRARAAPFIERIDAEFTGFGQVGISFVDFIAA